MILVIVTYNITIRVNFTKLDHVKSVQALDHSRRPSGRLSSPLFSRPD